MGYHICESSLQCRRVLGERRMLVYVRTVVTTTSFRVSSCAFASKTLVRPKKTPALQAIVRVVSRDHK